MQSPEEAYRHHQSQRLHHYVLGYRSGRAQRFFTDDMYRAKYGMATSKWFPGEAQLLGVLSRRVGPPKSSDPLRYLRKRFRKRPRKSKLRHERRRPGDTICARDMIDHDLWITTRFYQWIDSVHRHDTVAAILGETCPRPDGCPDTPDETETPTGTAEKRRRFLECMQEVYATWNPITGQLKLKAKRRVRPGVYALESFRVDVGDLVDILQVDGFQDVSKTVLEMLGSAVRNKR